MAPPSSPAVRAVLFDLDGTLIDTRRLYAEAYTRGFVETLSEPPTFEQLMQRRPASERLFLIDWYGPDVGDAIHRAMVAAYEALAPTHLDGLFEGVDAMLAGVRASGMRTAIVTGKSRAAWEVTARHVSLEGFDALVLEDDVPAPKPDPRGIEQALRALGVAPEQAVYVGDTPMDAEAARRAGVQPASALWWRPAAERARVASQLTDEWSLHEPADLLTELASRG